MCYWSIWFHFKTNELKENTDFEISLEGALNLFISRKQACMESHPKCCSRVLAVWKPVFLFILLLLWETKWGIRERSPTDSRQYLWDAVKYYKAFAISNDTFFFLSWKKKVRCLASFLQCLNQKVFQSNPNIILFYDSIPNMPKKSHRTHRIEPWDWRISVLKDFFFMPCPLLSLHVHRNWNNHLIWIPIKSGFVYCTHFLRSSAKCNRKWHKTRTSSKTCISINFTQRLF